MNVLIGLHHDEIPIADWLNTRMNNPPPDFGIPPGGTELLPSNELLVEAEPSTVEAVLMLVDYYAELAGDDHDLQPESINAALRLKEKVVEATEEAMAEVVSGHGAALGTADPPSVRFLRPREEGYSIVTVDVVAFDQDWQKEPELYIGPGGTGAVIGERYRLFGEWLKEGRPVEPPRVSILDDRVRGNRVTFGDGRHRFAYLRDLGLKRLPIIVPEEQAEEVRRRYG